MIDHFAGPTFGADFYD
jgi:hypothetical protein